MQKFSSVPDQIALAVRTENVKRYRSSDSSLPEARLKRMACTDLNGLFEGSPVCLEDLEGEVFVRDDMTFGHAASLISHMSDTEAQSRAAWALVEPLSRLFCQIERAKKEV